MSLFGDYMEGVPVKIFEKYKRPPRIELPYSIQDCTLRAQNVVDNVKYCSTFETNVLSKLKELRSAKETKKTERRHRLQLVEEAKQKKLDAIAAVEAEEKLKQLSVSDVSYPSTEEISAISPDEKADIEQNTTPTPDSSPEVAELGASDTYPCSSEQESQQDILQPIQVQSKYNHNLLDDPDPLQELKMNVKVAKMPQYRNIDTLTYKDFENDTSSPFDNVELKTINDMELLAQVLQSQRESSTSCPQQYIPDHTYTMVPNCVSQTQIEGMSYLPNTYIEQPVQGQVLYAPSQTYPNGYYVPENVCDNMVPVDNLNMYMPNYQYYIPSDPYVVDASYYSSQIPSVENNQLPNDPAYVPQSYYYQYPQVPAQFPLTNSYNASSPEQSEEKVPSNTQNSIKSRSRSVPDIVKELDEELEHAKQRANERSYNASPAPKMLPTSSSARKEDGKKSKKKSEQLPNPFSKLPPGLQVMCQRIHSMGFPLDRVARVCSLVGDSDKKVIEGLLIVGELMDLGFSEGRVSAALAKHDFNKDKALDELVS